MRDASFLKLLGALTLVRCEFGLEAQGHVPTIRRMLDEGATWEQIGQAIGWDGETARRWWHEQHDAARNEGEVDAPDTLPERPK